MGTHTLTTEQLRKFVHAIGDGSDWPKITDDSLVNFAIDCVNEDEDEEPTYDRQLYAAEVEAFRAHGSFA